MPGRPRPRRRLTRRDPARTSSTRAERYERFFRIEFVVSQARPDRRARRLREAGHPLREGVGRGPHRHGMLLGMIGLALVWLSQVPFRLAEVWWDRRYDQTDSGYFETLFANWSARRRVPVHLLRAGRRDGARRGVPAPLVARSGAVLRRARLPVRLHLPVPHPHRAAAPRRPARRRARIRGEAGDRSGAAARSRTSPTSRAPRTPTRSATGRASGSSSGTRSSTAASPTTR